MIKTFILFFLSLVLIQCSYAQDITVKLVNKTGYELDSLTVGKVYAGTLKKDSSVTLGYSEVTFVDDAPFVYAAIKGKTPYILPICGTMTMHITEGHYKFNIVIQETPDNKYHLFLNRDRGILTGKWHLVCDKDLQTRARTWRPAKYHKWQLSFSFMDDEHLGSIEGYTLINQVSGNYEITDTNQIHVDNFGGTKAGEVGWGSHFRKNILTADSFKLASDTLTINYDEDKKAMLFVKGSK